MKNKFICLHCKDIFIENENEPIEQLCFDCYIFWYEESI